MKSFFTYQIFLKRIVFLMLIGQLWGNIVTQCYWLIDMESTAIEFSSSDYDEENKKAKDDKINMTFIFSKHIELASVANSIYLEGLTPLFSPETATPPPQALIVS